MFSHIDQSENIKQYIFTTDGMLTDKVQRAAVTKLPTYQDYTWYKPKNVSKIFITAIGGGGSGAAGDVGGQKGGGSGVVSHLLVDADQIPDILTIRVGYGGDVSYGVGTVTSPTFTNVTNQYTHPNNAQGAVSLVTNVSVSASKTYNVYAWGAGGGGGGYNITSIGARYTYGGGGGGYSSITDFVPPSDGILTVVIPSHQSSFYGNGVDSKVLWSNSSVTNVELLFAGGGTNGIDYGSSSAAPGRGGEGRANSSFTGTKFTAKGGNATFLNTTAANRQWGSGGGGAGGPLSGTYDNNSYSRNGGQSGINGVTGGIASTTTSGSGGTGGSSSITADGLGGGGGGASTGVVQNTTTVGVNGGNGSFPGGGGGTGYYYRGLGNGGRGAAGCVRIFGPIVQFTDITPANDLRYLNGSPTVIFCGKPSDNVALLYAEGGPSGVNTSISLAGIGAFANSYNSKLYSRGAKIGQSSFYNGTPVSNNTSNVFMTGVVNSGVAGGKYMTYAYQGQSVSVYGSPATNAPNTIFNYASTLESFSPLYSLGGSGSLYYLSNGAAAGFGSGGGGGYLKGSYGYASCGGPGGSGLVILTCW